jgi:glycosyltransferase involved in cell wall biosynthesis
MAAPGEYRVGRLNRWAFAALDRLAEVNIMIAAAGEPNLRPYMPTVGLPVVHNSAVIDQMVQSTAVHDPPVVLFIGELLERKGILTLLDALDLLDERGVGGYDLRIIGDDRPGLDPDKDAMVAEIRRRGRGDAVTGPLSRAEVYDWLSRADLYVFPTWTEGQPFTVIEALASGVPIVASDIQAISAMMDDPAHGRLLDPHDAEAFAGAIAELLADPDRRRRISEANRARAHERFDRPVFRAHIAELYRQYGRPTAG